jgi:syntaxin 16
LQQLVLDQGTLLDRVDYNIELAAQNIKHGAEQLSEGASYQQQSVQRNMILLLACTVALLVAAVLVFLLGG